MAVVLWKLTRAIRVVGEEVFTAMEYGNGGEGGKGFLQGGAGGRPRKNAVGGFGGGGGAHRWGGGAGGGGGYSGGAPGNKIYGSCAGGGGSYNVGENLENSERFQDNGHGYVVINRIFPGV